MFRVGYGLDIFAVWRPVANSEHSVLFRGKIELKRVPSGDFDVQFLLDALYLWRVASLYTVGQVLVVRCDHEISEIRPFRRIRFVVHFTF